MKKYLQQFADLLMHRIETSKTEEEFNFYLKQAYFLNSFCITFNIELD